MWSQYINIEISSLLLWPIDLLLSDALLYFYDNKRILILILILNIGLSNGLVSSGSKQLPESVLTSIFGIMGRHLATIW